MTKQILKGFTMLALIVGLSFVSAVVSAKGQSTQAVAKVPFEFIVGEKTLPSGKYIVRRISDTNAALRIQSADGKDSAVRLTDQIFPKMNKTQARLVFHRYGERYFLSEVWMGADSTGRHLLKSRQEGSSERELASVGSRSKLAQNTFEVVEIVTTFR
jgi:hypothetical protein